MAISDRSFTTRATALAVAALLLAGCSLADDALGPSLDATEPTGAEGEAAAAEPGGPSLSPERTQEPVVGQPGAAPPILGTTVFETPGVTPGQPTGTVVGQKVDSLRSDLQRLQSNLAQHNDRLQTERASARQSANAYHGLVAAMNSRLQVGTTPGNPELVAQWNQAQQELQAVGTSIAELNTLANDTSETSALAAFLLESARATFELRGAVEEDHRQLAVLEDEVAQTVVIIDRLLNELSDDIARATNYYSSERLNLTAMQVAINNGEYIGGSLASMAFGVPQPPPPGGAAANVGARPPLVVIRFDRPTVDYEQALFTAVSQALERRPNAAFDVVAVAPGAGNPAQVSLETNKARRNAEAVLRTLVNMGLPADRMSLAATSDPNVQVNEVHVYVR